VQRDRAAGLVHHRDLFALQADVARLGHLERGGQVDPQLQDLERPAAFHECARRHLLVHHPAPGRHPLHAAGVDHAFVAGAVAVRQFALEDEGDGLEAAVRVRPERQAAVVRRVGLRPVVVQEQEGIDLVDEVVGQRPLGDQVADVVAHRRVQPLDGSVAHSCCSPLS
jgi:hypothetical protein